MIWYALLIPCVLSVLSFVIWHKHYVWQELLLPLAASLIFIVVSYFTLKTVDMRDVEYNGYVVVEARYYEPFDTWVHRTCSYTVSCGKNCTRVVYYDCSYCDHTPAKWVAIDNNGNTFDISQKKYRELIWKWGATPKFCELNRSISYHGSCGKDGDMYSVKWDFNIEHSEASVVEVPFQNIVKVSHSAFQFPNITQQDAQKLGLYDYPKFYDFYKQPAILGLDSFKMMYRFDKRIVQTKFEYLNGYLGPKDKVKIFTLLFKNKPIDIAFKQEAYWDGGNQNELVVCIGLNDDLKIEWVKPFSWCDNKRILVDTREDIANLKTFKPNEVFTIYYQNVEKFFKYKSFKDFNYLTFEPTSGQLWFVYVMTFVVSVGCIWWCVKNNIE